MRITKVSYRITKRAVRGVVSVKQGRVTHKVNFIFDVSSLWINPDFEEAVRSESFQTIKHLYDTLRAQLA